MKRYIPNQNLVIKHQSIICGDGTTFDFVPWERESRKAALASANEYEYDLRQAVQQRSGLTRPLTEREYQRAVKGQSLTPEPTGSVVGTSTPREEVNPYETLLSMKRKMNPDYRAQLEEKSRAWQADRDAKERRAELESTKEWQLMNEHAKATYRLAVNDPETSPEIVAERARLLKIADDGDYETYWKTVAEKKLDDTIFNKPNAEPTPPPQPTADLELPPIDLSVAEGE